MSELVVALGATPERQNLIFGLLSYRQLLGSFGYTNGVLANNGQPQSGPQAAHHRLIRNTSTFNVLAFKCPDPLESHQAGEVIERVQFAGPRLA